MGEILKRSTHPITIRTDGMTTMEKLIVVDAMTDVDKATHSVLESRLRDTQYVLPLAIVRLDEAARSLETTFRSFDHPEQVRNAMKESVENLTKLRYELLDFGTSRVVAEAVDVKALFRESRRKN